MKINGTIESTASISGSISPLGTAAGTITPENSMSGILGTGSVKELFFGNMSDFPSIGNGNSLYIDKESNNIYRFDPEKLVYVCTGNDYSEIDIIQSCL
ncbi:MAG: hypothetical protein ACI4I9_04550 [Porcipelethomonas sp.]